MAVLNGPSQCMAYQQQTHSLNSSTEYLPPPPPYLLEGGRFTPTMMAPLAMADIPPTTQKLADTMKTLRLQNGSPNTLRRLHSEQQCAQYQQQSQPYQQHNQYQQQQQHIYNQQQQHSMLQVRQNSSINIKEYEIIAQNGFRSLRKDINRLIFCG